MFSQAQARLFVATVLASAILCIANVPEAHARAIVTDPGCTANIMPRNDDAYTAQIPLGFDVYFGNMIHSTLRISNNGYVAFGSQTPKWWLLHNWTSYSVPLISMFYADVDTRPLGASPVTWGPITFAGRPALCVNWVNVGHYDMHDEVLNSFQLVLVNRSDLGVGDIDVYMNYDQIEWEYTLAPRVGIYDGSMVLHEIPGSNVLGSLIDGGPQALIDNSLNSSVLGRYVFELRNGVPPETALVSGTALDTNGVPVAGAAVSACDTCLFRVDACVFGTTNIAGQYSLGGFRQADINGCPVWKLKVSPPAGSELLTNTLDVTFTSTDQIISEADLVLDSPEHIPSDTSIVPSTGGAGTVPVVHWQSPLTLTTRGCGSVLGLDPPIARYMITRDGGDNLSRCDTGTPATDPGLVQCGPMIEKPPPDLGTYVASIPKLAPAHGLVTITMGLICPDDPDDEEPQLSGKSSFDVYIDPSGWVLTVHGTRLMGAKVTLFRSESALGPFEAVPDGSALMSPRNRTNPDYTDATGHFGWDTVPGFYVVRAEYPGCVDPNNPVQPYVDTDILPVPPEWLDLHLYLDCGDIPPPHLSLPVQVLAAATSTAGAVVSYQVSALDEHDGPVPVTCAPPSGELFSAGTTTVSCNAQNSVGNVAHGSFPVIVSYAWSHVLPPLQPGANNRFKRGGTVPVKLALTGASAGISNLVAHLYVAAVVGSIPGPEVPATSAGNGPHHSQFRYDPHDQQYMFNWSTKGLSEGHYRLRIDLGDGVSRTVPIELW